MHATGKARRHVGKWMEVGVIKAFEEGPSRFWTSELALFSVKEKDDPHWWRQSLLREGYGKDKLL